MASCDEGEDDVSLDTRDALVAPEDQCGSTAASGQSIGLPANPDRLHIAVPAIKGRNPRTGSEGF